MKYQEAMTYAIRAGATEPEIAAEAQRQERHVGTVPQRNMIKALTMCSRLNTRDDWVRLAGALRARRKATMRPPIREGRNNREKF